MATAPTTFVNAATVADRDDDYPITTDFSGGMNSGGCAPGIGINIGVANIQGTPEQFTLLDQEGDARAPQNSQYIGGDGLGEGESGAGTVAISVVTNDTDGEGSVTVTGDATLNSLATGWISDAS